MVIKSYHIILAFKILGWFLLKWADFGELLGWKSSTRSGNTGYHQQPLFRSVKKKYKRARSMSAVRQYFRLDQPSSKTSTCLIWHAAISRGSTSINNFNTSKLIKHLKTHHFEEHDVDHVHVSLFTARQRPLLRCWEKDKHVCVIIAWGNAHYTVHTLIDVFRTNSFRTGL